MFWSCSCVAANRSTSSANRIHVSVIFLFFSLSILSLSCLLIWRKSSSHCRWNIWKQTWQVWLDTRSYHFQSTYKSPQSSPSTMNSSTSLSVDSPWNPVATELCCILQFLFYLSLLSWRTFSPFDSVDSVVPVIPFLFHFFYGWVHFSYLEADWIRDCMQKNVHLFIRSFRVTFHLFFRSFLRGFSFVQSFNRVDYFPHPVFRIFADSRRASPSIILLRCIIGAVVHLSGTSCHPSATRRSGVFRDKRAA